MMAWLKRRLLKDGKTRSYQVMYANPATGKEKSAGTYKYWEAADKRRREIEREIDLGITVDTSSRKTLYRDWGPRWLGNRTDLKPKTVESYEGLMRSRVLPTFGEMRIGYIETQHIETWIAEMNREGLSASRIRQAFNVLSPSLKAAVNARILQANPAAAAENLPRIRRREMLHIDAVELERLAGAISGRYKALIYVLGYCGLRSGEAYALRRSSVNTMKQELRITESATPVNGRLVLGTPKTHQARTVGIPGHVTEELERHLAAQLKEPRNLGKTPAEVGELFVFTSPSGEMIAPSNFRRRVWRPALAEAGLPAELRIHDLRHSAVSILINADIPITSIRDHVGHSTIVTTVDRYGHLYEETRRQVTAALDGVAADALQRQDCPKSTVRAAGIAG